MKKIILFNKPYNVLSQFTDAKYLGTKRLTLSNFINIKGVYAAGRLDKDSEGLLLLTNSGLIQEKITNPMHKVSKGYWVQVEGDPSETKLNILRNGIYLRDGITRKAVVEIMEQPDGLWPRFPPIRIRKTVSETWLKMIISEGRNRQIRRMTAAIGHPTLRLIRYRIGLWKICNIKSGDYSEILV